MKLNYTKTTKEHIAQMAVRKKYLKQFDKKFATLKTAITNQASELGDHKELFALPEHLHKNFIGNRELSNWQNVIFEVKQYIALQTSWKHRRIELDHKIYTHQNLTKQLISDDSKLIRAFKKFIDEVDVFALDIEISLNTYSTYNKALNALPWIDGLHPDKDKVTTCNLVPIDTINKVNELMGKL